MAQTLPLAAITGLKVALVQGSWRKLWSLPARANPNSNSSTT
jgi:hypothetical protein